MDPTQYTTLMECLSHCDKLLKEMTLDRDRIIECMNGDLRKAYLDSNEKAMQELKSIRRQLQLMLT